MSSVTVTPAIVVAEPTKVDAVQKLLIAEIEKRGIVHVLEWIGQWYTSAAKAFVADEMARQLDDKVGDKEALELSLLEKLLSDASGVANYSTGSGHNLFRQAVVAATASRLREVSAATRSARWDAVRTRFAAETQS
ncbi:hypothetical protein ABIC83_002991 [Roseateles asaccharophilus]|uniref:hypothetical protein n=1 Tax=Roseateles asaccharophilus TaxID=582607 RepID=UPI0038370390